MMTIDDAEDGIDLFEHDEGFDAEVLPGEEEEEEEEEEVEDESLGDDDEPSPEEVAAWLKSQGYRVDPPGGFEEDGEEDYGGYDPDDDPYAQLEESFQAAYAQEDDESERAALVVEFNRRMRDLDRQADGERAQAMEQVQAYIEGQAHLPEVAEIFESRGLPREAASDYVTYLAQCPAVVRARPEVQAAMLERAVGSAILSSLAGNANEVPLPRGESPGGSAAVSIDGVSPEVVASIRQNFPQLGPLTPAKIAKLKREGIF
jgi:hypothetical protein